MRGARRCLDARDESRFAARLHLRLLHRPFLLNLEVDLLHQLLFVRPLRGDARVFRGFRLDAQALFTVFLASFLFVVFLNLLDKLLLLLKRSPIGLGALRLRSHLG